jgi:hypothetical protein
VLRETFLKQLGFNLAKHLMLGFSLLGEWRPLAATDAGGLVHDAHEIASHASADLNFNVFEFQHTRRKPNVPLSDRRWHTMSRLKLSISEVNGQAQ